MRVKVTKIFVYQGKNHVVRKITREIRVMILLSRGLAHHGSLFQRQQLQSRDNKFLGINVVVTKEGLTNAQLIAMRRVPRDPASDNQKIHLHHIGQKPDSPFAELTTDEDLLYKGNAIHYPEQTMINLKEYRMKREKHWRERLKISCTNIPKRD